MLKFVGSTPGALTYGVPDLTDGTPAESRLSSMSPSEVGPALLSGSSILKILSHIFRCVR
jgi:hypothetical protein